MSIPVADLVGELERISQTDLNDSVAVGLGASAMKGVLLGENEHAGDEVAEMLSASIVEALQNLYEKHEINTEFDFSRKVLSGHLKIEDYPTYELYREYILAEVAMAEIKPTDRVLFIGSGPFPISPILLAEISGATIDCYDNSQDAYDISETLIEKMGLNEKIKIHKTNGEQASTKEYDLVIVAVMAQPKNEILSNIFQQIKDEAKLICRNSMNSKKLFYKGTDSDSIITLNGFEQRNSYMPKSGKMVSCLYQKASD